MSKFNHDFGRRNYTSAHPLTAAEIRACEERVGLRKTTPKKNSPRVGGDNLGDLGEMSAVSPSTTLQGGISPNSPNNIPYGDICCMGEGVGEKPTPVTPYDFAPGGDVGDLGEMKKSRKTNKAKKPLLTIVEDTREQTPLVEWPEWVAVESGTCHTGDYTVKGWEMCFCIERKTLQDFAGTMLGGYESSSEKPKKRFNRELERMRHYDCAAVIVTATPQEVIEFRHHCGMDAHAALWNFGLSVFANYRIPVFYLGDAKTAARCIADLARHYVVARTKKNFTKEDRSLKALAEWRF